MTSQLMCSAVSSTDIRPWGYVGHFSGLCPCCSAAAAIALAMLPFHAGGAGCIPQPSDAAFLRRALHAKMLDGFISSSLVHRTKICHQAILASYVFTCVFHGDCS